MIAGFRVAWLGYIRKLEGAVKIIPASKVWTCWPAAKGPSPEADDGDGASAVLSLLLVGCRVESLL
jgi:hypothetical protein